MELHKKVRVKNFSGWLRSVHIRSGCQCCTMVVLVLLIRVHGKRVGNAREDGGLSGFIRSVQK